MITKQRLNIKVGLLLGKEYAKSNRRTVGSSVLYKVHAKVI
jgi:hypothetical protein